ncbi:MAG: nucleoside phosphorylase [Bacteroidales bacterium]|jgi:uridine phosphorylase|nr:nucleoside phosphorylase [Bacteroidales bacterium]
MSLKKNRSFPERALVVGDSSRVLEATELLESPREIWRVREYLAWEGFYRGKQITVASHGVGASGASMILEHLFRGGVKSVIRAGTCGSLSDELSPGTLVIPTAAIRDDGVSSQILPIEFPAVADHQMLNALIEEANRVQYENIRTGVVWSSGLFYPSPYVDSRSDIWMESGALAVEMEMALVFIMAELYKARAGGILAVEGGADEELDPWNRPVDEGFASSTIKSMLKISLEALTKVSCRENE